MKARALRVEVEALDALAGLAVASVGGPARSRVEVTVSRWRPPVAGWIGAPGIAGVIALEVRSDDRSATVQLSVSDPTDPGVLLAAALRCLRPHPTGEIEAMVTFAPGLPESAGPLADRLVDVLLADETRDKHVRRCDLLVTPSVDAAAGVDRAATLVVERDWTVDGEPAEAWVDPAVHRPVGRRSVIDGDVATAAVDDGVTVVTWPGGEVRIGADVRASEARALRAVRAVVPAADVSRRMLAQLAACGIVVAADPTDLPAPDDDLAWQVASVEAHRAALRGHSAPAAVMGWPSVSVVIATHRPDHIENALRQIAAFEYPELEVVIGAHGRAVDVDVVWSYAKDLPHRATVVAVDADRTLGEVLRVCTARTEGTLVTKVDDDDIYGPQHIWDLVLARHYSGAQIVGKALDWIHVESENVTVFRPTYPAEKYAPFVAGGTILISRADLGAVGGWRPVPKSVDRALLDRVLADGGLVYRTHGLGYVYVRGGHGHTASVQDAHFLTKIAASYPGLIAHGAFGTA